MTLRIWRVVQLKDIETDKREQIYEAEIKKETPYRHKGGTAYDAVDAASNYTGFGVSDGNDTTGNSELQASEKTDIPKEMQEKLQRLDEGSKTMLANMTLRIWRVVQLK